MLSPQPKQPRRRQACTSARCYHPQCRHPHRWHRWHHPNPMPGGAQPQPACLLACLFHATVLPLHMLEAIPGVHTARLVSGARIMLPASRSVGQSSANVLIPSLSTTLTMYLGGATTNRLLTCAGVRVVGGEGSRLVRVVVVGGGQTGQSQHWRSPPSLERYTPACQLPPSLQPSSQPASLPACHPHPDPSPIRPATPCDLSVPLAERLAQCPALRPRSSSPTPHPHARMHADTQPAPTSSTPLRISSRASSWDRSGRQSRSSRLSTK